MDLKTKKSIEDLAGEGIRYESYDQLATALHRMAKRGHQYRISSSEMLRNANGSPDTQFRYRSLVLHCVHFGEPRRRGCGTRTAKYLATGCKSFFRITYRFGEQALVVTKSRLPHKGHKLEITPVGRPQNYSTKYGVRRMKKVKALPKPANSSIEPSSKKQINPAEEMLHQINKLNSLLKLQKKMYAMYSSNRASLGLPPYKFHPPPLKTDTLWYYFHLEQNPFVDPVKPDEAEDGDIDVVGIDDPEVKEEEEECPPEVNSCDEYGTEFDSANEGGDEMAEEDELISPKDPNNEDVMLSWLQYDAPFSTAAGEVLETEIVNCDTSVYNENYFVETIDSIAM